MRIAIDARTAYARQRRGTGRNLVDLYRTLAALRPDWDFIMFHQTDADGDPFAGVPNIRHERIDIPGDRLNLWQDVRLPLAAQASGADVLHCPANTAPWSVSMPTVVTIHDLIPLSMAPDASAAMRWLRRMRRTVQYARRIVTPSEYSRGMIATTLGVPPDRITVNYWAPDLKCRRIEAPLVLRAVRQKYGVPAGARYVLAFGAADPRKNTAGVLEAWSRVPAGLREDSVLLVVGLQASVLDAYRTLALTHVFGPSCLLHGFADEGDLGALLSGAVALCYPSRSEGFGLPVLDAFACGTPVITSSSTSLPEVAGDAALLVDPDDVDAIAGALARILSSSDIRERLGAAGARRARLFSWERCAGTLAEVLESAAA